jgi:hypothetical protein
VAKLDALRLAGAKEPDRLQIHQRYLGHLQCDRAAAAPNLGPEFDEIFRAEPPDQLDACTVLFRHRLDFECHTGTDEQRMGQPKTLKSMPAGEKGPAAFSAFAELSAKKWPRSRILWALLSSPAGLKRPERVEESGCPEAILFNA